MVISLRLPMDGERAKGLRAGDILSLDGELYVARDAAHKKMTRMLDGGLALPFDPAGQIIYFAGPCPARPGRAIGSCGPTTSGRMDSYAPRIIKEGLLGIIGKGEIGADVTKALIARGGLYLGATGGAGALIARSILSARVIAFPELGPEAIRLLVVKNFPAIVILDSKGNNLYKIERKKYGGGAVK